MDVGSVPVSTPSGPALGSEGRTLKRNPAIRRVPVSKLKNVDRAVGACLKLNEVLRGSGGRGLSVRGGRLSVRSNLERGSSISEEPDNTIPLVGVDEASQTITTKDGTTYKMFVGDTNESGLMPVTFESVDAAGGDSSVDAKDEDSLDSRSDLFLNKYDNLVDKDGNSVLQ